MRSTWPTRVPNGACMLLPRCSQKVSNANGSSTFSCVDITDLLRRKRRLLWNAEEQPEVEVVALVGPVGVRLRNLLRERSGLHVNRDVVQDCRGHSPQASPSCTWYAVWAGGRGPRVTNCPRHILSANPPHGEVCLDPGSVPMLSQGVHALLPCGRVHLPEIEDLGPVPAQDVCHVPRVSDDLAIGVQHRPQNLAFTGFQLSEAVPNTSPAAGCLHLG